MSDEIMSDEISLWCRYQPNPTSQQRMRSVHTNASTTLGLGPGSIEIVMMRTWRLNSFKLEDTNTQWIWSEGREQ
ncbi:uncharacterized protein MYCFIDRAFT_174244 [Pseudocercospora fijiensis CIRAD86]|uniref:Uncharacterized protein n=1 Tax=Pseudocercospora fijiensis (strain CIRAD86) TaxID=383855 RepID=M3AZU7_PSEFD|nr:uncharacterized protein MYCFIDRAFT_174244 [Pseudocercospora fijiensis CIRAD86]EME82688.1 hypothetical protein MYCFIDRAFT_174244 [Pseudocercospora fijiensis CIRAD86]